MIQRGDSIRVVHPLFQEEGSGSTPTSPLQLQVNECDTRRAAMLNQCWHSALPNTYLANLLCGFHSVCFSADFSGFSYAVAIWSDPVQQALANGSTIELRRLAIADDAPKFTASRMLAVMVRLIRVKFPDVRKAISYQAVGIHLGTIYKASGWTQAAYVKFQPWNERKTRKRDGVFQHKHSQRQPAQIKTDKIRWEKLL